MWGDGPCDAALLAPDTCLFNSNIRKWENLGVFSSAELLRATPQRPAK